MRGSSAGTAMLALVLLLAGAAPARATTVINLGDFIPNALNGHRQIVGDSHDPNADQAPTHAELWSRGVLTRLAEPAGTDHSDAYAINASGRIAGDSVSTTTGSHAIYWDGATGVPHQIGPIKANGIVDYSAATGVDDSGDVVGNTLDADTSPFGFLSPGGSGITHVGPGYTNVNGITPNGQKILGQILANEDESLKGWYLWPGPSGAGTKLDLTPFPQGSYYLGAAETQQFGTDLASDGTVLGYKGTVASPSYYLRLPNGTETPVNGLIGHNGVNAKHTVIGTILSSYKGQPVPHAAIWKPDGSVIDLNSLLPANSDYILGDALAINDNGDIVGIAGQISTQTEVGFLLPAGYVVDSTGDQADEAPGDGNCLTAQDTCTLRAALQEVNSDKVASPTAIAFSLPGGSGTIAPTSPLPAAQYPVALDGGTHVVLNGAGAGDGANGLILEGDESTVRGLEFDGFERAGIRIEASNVYVGGLPADTTPCSFPCNTFKNQGGPAVAVASGTQNLIEGNRMTGGSRPAIDLGSDGRTPNDAKDADTGADGLHNFPIGVLGERDPVSKVLKVSGVDQQADEGDAIDVYAQSAESAARGAEPTDYVGSTQVGYLGGWVLDAPASLPASDTFFSATVTTAHDGTSELSPVCGDPDGDGNPDSDGDGLCDDWELHGIDADDDGTIDAPLPGASPTHKDLYLEIDAMLSQVPSQGAIDDVVQAFANAPVENATGGTGIALHATLDETVPDIPRFAVTGTGPGTLDGRREGSLSEPCDGSFGTADRARGEGLLPATGGARARVPVGAVRHQLRRAGRLQRLFGRYRRRPADGDARRLGGRRDHRRRRRRGAVPLARRVPADRRRRHADARARALARPAPRRPRRGAVQAQLPQRHELPVPDAVPGEGPAAGLLALGAAVAERERAERQRRHPRRRRRCDARAGRCRVARTPASSAPRASTAGARSRRRTGRSTGTAACRRCRPRSSCTTRDAELRRPCSRRPRTGPTCATRSATSRVRWTSRRAPSRTGRRRPRRTC